VAVLDRLIGEDRGFSWDRRDGTLSGLRENERDLLEAQFTALEFETDRALPPGRAPSGRHPSDKASPSSPDALIAALCLRHDLTLLENDGHFEHISGLKRFPWRPS